MYDVDGVAHPLVRNAAGKLPVQTKLKISLRIKGPLGLGHQPGLPICVLLPDLLYLRPPAPTWTVIIPDDLHLAYITEGSAPRYVMSRDLVRLAPMLCAHLHNRLCLQHGITRRFRFVEHVAHWLLDVRVLTSLGG